MNDATKRLREFHLGGLEIARSLMQADVSEEQRRDLVEMHGWHVAQIVKIDFGELIAKGA